MDVSISTTSSFNESSTSDSSLCDDWDSSYLVPDTSTYQSLFEVSTGVTVLLFIFYATVSVIAVVGNSLVLWILTKTRRMQNITNIFTANLALADTIIGIFVIPFQVSQSTPNNILHVIPFFTQ
jgi:leucokinin receptor